MQYYYQNMPVQPQPYGPADPEKYKQHLYRKALKKDANKLGLLLIIIEACTIALSFVFLFLENKSIIDKSSDLYNSFYIIENGLIYILMLFVPSLIFILATRSNLNDLFPFEKNKSKNTFLYICVGTCIAIASNYVCNLFAAILGSVGIDTSVESTIESTNITELILELIITAILPALIEELIFRGIILGTLKKYSQGLAILISGSLFALMHANLTQIPFAFPIGIALGYICIKTNSLLPGIIIHCINNANAVFLTYLENNEVFSDSITEAIELGIFGLIAIVGVIAAVILLKKHSDTFRFTDSNDVIPFRQKLGTLCKSPTMIVFTAFVLFESVLLVISNFLGVYG